MSAEVFAGVRTVAARSEAGEQRAETGKRKAGPLSACVAAEAVQKGIQFLSRMVFRERVDSLKRAVTKIERASLHLGGKLENNAKRA